jgi:hypothetical protein
VEQARIHAADQFVEEWRNDDKVLVSPEKREGSAK